MEDRAMVWWGIFVGVLVGWSMDSAYGGFGAGAILGGLFGWLAGVLLRSAVRAEIRAAMADLAPVETALPAGIVPVPEPEAEEAIPAPAMERREIESLGEEGPEEPPLARTGPEQEAGESPSPVTHGPEAWVRAARDWLLGGNTIVRAGLAILFIGLTFLVRFAASAGWFPIELRLALVGATGAALVALGFNRRLIRPTFGLAVQGAGVAILYLTVFASSRIYEILPPAAGFALMVVFCGLACVLALLQNAQALAFASFGGGFAVPLLLGGQADTPLGLFTYGTILNLAILVIAWRRSWRTLNLLGFVATFGIAALWGATSYEPHHYAVCQAFLAASVVIYLLTAILYAHNTPGRFGNFADGTLLFGPAIAGFGLQVGMVHRFEYGSALGALGFAAVYIGLAMFCLRKRRDEMRVLIECMAAIGIGFVTLAIPLALDARWTSSSWALEGAGAFWVGMRQARWMQRVFGLALQAVAVLVFLVTLEPNISAVPLFNGGFVGGLLVTVPLFLTAWWLRKPLPHSASPLARRYVQVEYGSRYVSFLVGFGLAAITIMLEIGRLLPEEVVGDLHEAVLSANLQRLTTMLALLAAMALSAWLGRRRDWPVATWPGRASLFVLAFTLLSQVLSGRNVLYWPDIAFFGLGLGLHLHLMREEDRDLGDGPETMARGWQRFIHAGTVWLCTAMLANAIYLAIERGRLWDTSWAGVINLDSAAAVLFVLSAWAGKRVAEPADKARWPLDRYSSSYYWTAAVPLAVLVACGALATALFAEGVTAPLPYVPLINPVDLSLVLALLVLVHWRRTLASAVPTPSDGGVVTGPNALAIAALMGFVFVNTIWLRTAHHWLGVDWSADALLTSFEVQTGLAILWTMLAMALMIAAHRRALRVVWLAGAALLVMVVVKLVLVDLSNSGGWERVVAFIAVGGLMLVIGYFAPLPPAYADDNAGEPA
ncbi:DUF2339 domain-containing protein [Novosphingobium malaysiense]|uniref:DUF2339 domain-containing protein n=1 Tax=Novosphingobium malaysiense TaxID=1348853 RepID=UPI001E5453FE|nr:DUF2339 domain-containing protein [Novosphingobium malaysiense]